MAFHVSQLTYTSALNMFLLLYIFSLMLSAIKPHPLPPPELFNITFYHHGPKNNPPGRRWYAKVFSQYPPANIY